MVEILPVIIVHQSENRLLNALKRLLPNLQRMDVATAILIEEALVNQPEKTELEYRVKAINKSGEGTESNPVNVVL